MTMPMFRKRPVVVQAGRWFRDGDLAAEGLVVHYYCHPGDPGTRACAECGAAMHDHGWIDTLEGGHVACPGDWIIRGVAGELYPCKDAIFNATYELVEDDDG